VGHLLRPDNNTKGTFGVGPPKTSKRDDENSMWSWFEDLVIDGRLLSFTDHAGIKREERK
jgi:hypothetical protein